MLASKVAARLTAEGFTVISCTQGTQEEDGDVGLSEKVHVQVPTRGRDLFVVREADDGFYFGEPRTEWSALANDIRAALREEAKGKALRDACAACDAEGLDGDEAARVLVDEMNAFGMQE